MDQPTNLTPSELANRWRVTEAALRKWRQSKVGPPWFKLGAKLRNAPVRYPLEGIEKFERAGVFNPPTP